MMRNFLFCSGLIAVTAISIILLTGKKHCDIFITDPDTAKAIALEYLIKQEHLAKNLYYLDDIKRYMVDYNCCNAFLGKGADFPYWEVNFNLPTRCGYLKEYTIWVNQCGGGASYKGSTISHQNLPSDRIAAEQSGKC
jgi:hypothetical protein